MPAKKKLQEEFEKIKKEDIKEEIKKTEKRIADNKKKVVKLQLKQLRNDIVYVFIISTILGFILWAWKPLIFSYWKSLAAGTLWYLLFEELKLHKMFKKE